MDILEKEQQKFSSIKPNREDNLTYDLGSLVSFDPQTIDFKILPQDIEKTLLDVARDDVQFLFNKIFELPTKRIENGVAAKLPEPITKLPREKHVPKPKPETRWEKFAKEKGIKNKKKEKIEFDQYSKEWKPTFGKNKANKSMEDWIIPAKPTDDVGSDPFAEKQKQKSEKKLKQKRNEKANREKLLSNGSNRKLPATIALSSKSVPMQLEEKKNKVKEGFKSVQASTISMGRFDKLLPDEKKVKQKRKFDPLISNIEQEKSKNMKLIDRVLSKPKLDVDKAARRATVSQQKKRSMTFSKGKKSKRN